MKKFYFSMIAMLCGSSMMFAQNSVNSDDFKPSGKPIATIFTDFSSITSGSTSTTSSKTNNTFELSRAYFGYAYNFSPNFSAKVLFDVANIPASSVATATPSSFEAYIKNAYVEYNDNLFTVDFGMVPETMFGLQESTWGKRYLYKSYQDQYGYGNSADLGLTAKIKFVPQLLSFDLSLTNGEGYKKMQADSTFRVGLGLTFTPIKEITARVYYDYYKKADEPAYTANQNTFNAFASFKNKDFMLSAEYIHANGFGRVVARTASGCSIYGAWYAAKFINVFARFDDATSNTFTGKTTQWNSAVDGQTYIVGVEFVPVKGVQIAPNFRYYNPTVSTTASSSTLAVNVGLNF